MSSSPIILANPSYTVIILDIPTSIATAQYISESHLFDCASTSPAVKEELLGKVAGNSGETSNRVSTHIRLVSCPELSEPYQNTYDPKLGTKTYAKLLSQKQNSGHWELDQILMTGSREALLDASNSLGQDARWSLDRALAPEDQTESTQIDVGTFRMSINAKTRESAGSRFHQDAEHLQGNSRKDLVFHNTSRERRFVSIMMSPDGQDKNRGFYIPGLCSFNLCHLRRSPHEQIISTTSRRLYHVIVIDPPWPSRSARRKRAYAQEPARANTLGTMVDELRTYKLDRYLAPDGFIAIWTTNRHDTRHEILKQGGLFDIWGVELAEEWVWLKVTKDGEPVIPLDSLSRKPWESLLVGKHNMRDLGGNEIRDETLRRYIIAVPDLHSRKPCLKSLFSKILLEGDQEMEVLELFARHLVTGWTSIGDEVLKFNEQDCWIK